MFLGTALAVMLVAPNGTPEAQYTGCGAGCMECAFHFFIGRYCNPVDGRGGRCECHDLMTNDGNLCAVGGDYCYGVIIYE